MNIVDVLRSGRPRTERHAKALRDVRWRQRFSGEQEYLLDLAGGTTLVVHQTNIEGSTGGAVWPAAHALARYIQRNARRVGDVVDLGCGTGAAGLACAALGATRVVLTDVEEVLWLARKNAAQIPGVVVVPFDWSKASTRVDALACDLVLASECVLPQLYPLEPLADALAAILKLREGCVGLVAYEKRTYPAFDPRERFRSLLADRGVSLTVTNRDAHDPDFAADDLEIWEIRVGVETQIGDGLRVLTWGPPACRFELRKAGETRAFDVPHHPRDAIGAASWPSALATARYFLHHSSSRPPLRVLELGSGCGLAATVLSHLGHDVLATDLPDVCVVLRRATPVSVEVAPLAWGDSDSCYPSDLASQRFDLVLCSDCVYDSTAVTPLLSTLAHLWQLPNPPSALFIANEQRTALDTFLATFRKHPLLRHLRLRALPVPESYWTIDCAPPDRQPPPIALFEANNN
ncbi:hypothetical protein CTAYLR_001493 [Chrysophaeum taylorii]|uniref:Methyltransferase domain-containing protein n=1 Tax=Chrysophaeum taylorii TaxID=2483200 RepID=A0AAD7XIJ1_9STRA|nr:hypothetical protein CTAYLR_001493 [Chrysophaeum taylorii]